MVNFILFTLVPILFALIGLVTVLGFLAAGSVWALDHILKAFKIYSEFVAFMVARSRGGTEKAQ
jgi:hypothetical protein